MLKGSGELQSEQEAGLQVPCQVGPASGSAAALNVASSQSRPSPPFLSNHGFPENLNPLSPEPPDGEQPSPNGIILILGFHSPSLGGRSVFLFPLHL